MRISKYNFILGMLSRIIFHQTHETLIAIKDQKEFLTVYIGDTIFDLFFSRNSKERKLKIPLIFPYKKGNTWILVANNEWNKLNSSLKSTTIWFGCDCIEKLKNDNCNEINASTYINCLIDKCRLERRSLEYYIILRAMLSTDPYFTMKPCNIEDKVAIEDLACFHDVLFRYESSMLEYNFNYNIIDIYNKIYDKYDPSCHFQELKEKKIFSISKRVYYLIKKYAHSKD